MSIDHIKKKTLYEVADRTYQMSSSLKGLSALLNNTSSEIPLDRSEFSGLGNLLLVMSQELEEMEDVLRTGDVPDLRDKYKLN